MSTRVSDDLGPHPGEPRHSLLVLPTFTPSPLGMGGEPPQTPVAKHELAWRLGLSTYSLVHPLVPQRARRSSPLERAAATLLRLVRSDTWKPEPAAQDLRARVHNDQMLLRLLHARVARAMLDRPTETDVRARATLERAMADDALAVAVRDSAVATRGRR